jgi:hypothetical protein
MEIPYGIAEILNPLSSLPFEALLKPSNPHVERPWLYNSLVVQTNERQIVGRQFERQMAALPRLQGNFREALQSF